MTSRLEDLIAELCPNGVEYKKIGDIATLSRGKVMSKSFIKDNSGEYPVYSSQTENNGQFGAISTYMYDGKYVTWTTDGANAGTVFYRDGKFNVTNVCGVIDISDCQVDTKYVYYALTIHAKNYVSSGMGNAKLMSNVMSKVTIPVPPLEVQAEIVRILDTFTELTAELTAELTDRKKQYEYYRDTLLTFNDNNPLHSLIQRYCPNGVEYKALEYVASYSKNRIDSQILDEHNYVGVENLLQNKQGKTLANSIPKESKAICFSIGDVLIGNIRPYLKKIWFADCVGGTNGDVLVIHIHDKNVISPRFLYHILSSERFFLYDVRNSKGAKMPRGDKKAVMQFEIPVPPLEVQHQIVQILDRFDALCNDLTQGLPAEIEARRKQYEYYRDLLLTFKRA